jgi:hypothetical protein
MPRVPFAHRTRALPLLSLVAGAALAIAACTHDPQAREYKAEDGTKAFEALCRGKKLSIEDCKSVAEKTCYGPFDIIDVPGTKDRRLRFQCKDGGAAITAAVQAKSEAEAQFACQSAETWFWEIPRIVCESDTEVCEFVADRSSEKDCHKKT